MCAIGRALMAKPKLLMLDEPSLGLAPILVERIFDIVREINKTGTAILLVEQNALIALAVANRGYVLETGHVALHDTAEALRRNEQVRKAYLGESLTPRYRGAAGHHCATAGGRARVGAVQDRERPDDDDHDDEEEQSHARIIGSRAH